MRIINFYFIYSKNNKIVLFLIAKRRREEKNFPGAEPILEQIKNGVLRKRVGIQMIGGPPARQGVDIVFENQNIGKITSGCPSPSNGGNVAMGYVKTKYAKLGANVELNIRGKLFPASVSKMPFVASKYYVKPK